ncbi:MAG: transposase domain-containing protein, partial [Mesorhizobium sp.]
VWLAHVLARLPAYPAHRIDDLLPWNWRSAKLQVQPAAA